MKTSFTKPKMLMLSLAILMAFSVSAQLTGQYMAAIQAPTGNHRVVLYDANNGTLVNDNFINLSALNSGTPKGLTKVGNEIWVTDQIRDRVDRFTLEGAWIDSIGGRFPGGGMDNLRGIGVVGNEVWVANAGTANGAPGNAIVRIDFAGNILGHFLVDGSPWEPIVYNNEVLLSYSAAGGFLSRIERYDFNGVALGSWNTAGELNFIQQIAEMSNGHILAAAFSNTTGGLQNGVYEYNTNGVIVGPVGGSLGSGPRGVGQLNNGNIMWTSGGGVFITDVTTGNATNIVTGSAQFVKMINFSDQPIAVALPFHEDFEGADFPPLGWVNINNDGGGNEWESTTIFNHTPGGSKSARHNYGPFGYTEDGWFITPGINFPAGGNIQMSFWSYNSFPADYGKNSLLISTGSGNPADGDFVEIWTTPSVVTAWEETVLDLSAFANNIVYLAFRYEGTFAHAWYIDDIHIDAITIGGVEGVVTDANNNMPITGALVTVGNQSMMTLGDGSYTFDIQGGTQTIVVEKIGYETASAEVEVTGGIYTVQNFALVENANPPGAVHAVLNTSQTAVNINWALPGGPYEIVYDDGTFENLTAWPQAGNMNALRFTPVAYPVNVVGGSVNIGDGSYPSGNILTTFEIAIYDQDSSPFGWPGNELIRFEVTPTDFGWVEFTLPEAVTITDGDFYIVMIQGGNYPNCAPIAIDETNPSLRSYSRFVSGNAPWTFAGYSDFMMRAIVSGPGGPWGMPTASNSSQFIEATRPHIESLSVNAPKAASGYMRDAEYIPVETNMPQPEDLLGYRVFRFEQGQEGDEGVWTTIGNPSGTVFVDNGWPTIPNGAYRWAVKARYSNDRLSPASLSNVIGKGWTVDAVTFNLSLSSGAAPAGIEVVMVNQLVPDSTYAAVSGENGVVVFNNVWKGTYDISVYKFGFEPWTRTEELTSNKTYNIMLLQFKNPPRGLFVNERTLMANWQPPIMQAMMLEETFSSGSFATNNWTSEPNWAVWTGFGNPAPSARFNWSPSITNYSRSLTSKPLMGVGAPYVWFEYDVFLSNFSLATIEKLAAEVWNGTEWIAVKTYDNQAGNIAWTSESVDITEYAVGEFRVRFRAYGDNSFNINNWNIDNIRVVGVETDFSVMGYNFYVDDLQVGFVTETEFQIPQILITYGQNYLAEVAAVYQSGVSPRIDYAFTSLYLPEPNNLQGINVENAVQLTWEVPFIPIDIVILSTEERTEIPDPSMEYSPTITHAIYPESRALYDILGSFAHADAGGEYGVATDGNFIYTARWNAGDFYRYNMDGTYVGSFTIAGAGNLRDITYDGTYFYASNNSSTIYQMDFVNQTLVSSFSTSVATIRAIAYDAVNDGFWVSNGWNPPLTLVSRTGATLQTVSAAASSFSGLGWENVSPGGPFLWGLTQPASNNILVKIDIATGATLETFDVGTTGLIGAGISGGMDITHLAVPGKWAFLGSAQNDVVWMLELGDYTGGGGAPVQGLIGYNIYRDNAMHMFVEVPELEFWDLNMLPGNYKYTATGVYDLTFFGLTGTDESLHSNEVTVGVNDFGYPLPFVEEWNSANFTFNNWDLAGPDMNHWRVTTAQGNPVPAAEFTWSPPVKEYQYWLTSPPLNAAPFTCADIYLSFDIKLNDRNETETEKLIVQHFVNGNWLPLKEFKNNGSFNWTNEVVQMPLATGKTFHIRFVAMGDNSSNILSWFIDNIYVYAECRPPLDLTGVQIGGSYNAFLEWAEPDCETGASGTLVKLSQWDGAPTNAYFQQYNYAYGVVYNLGAYPDATLELVDFHHASWGVLGTWSYKIHVINWSNYQIIATIGPLTTTGNDKWENGLQLGEIMGYGGGLIGIMLEPMSNSASDAYPCFSADNIGPNGLSLWGQIPNFSAFATSTVGDFMQNLWIRTSFAKSGELVKLEPVTTIEEIAETRAAASKSQNVEELVQHSRPVPSFDNAATKDSPVQGYNVYRSHDEGITFDLISPAPVTTLSYTDMNVTPGDYIYQVTALYAVCESVPASFPLSITVGIDEVANDGIMVYPIPATTHLNVTLRDDIRNLRIINYMGQMVYEQNIVSQNTLVINTSEYKPGAYLLQFVTESGETITRRVVISK